MLMFEQPTAFFLGSILKKTKENVSVMTHISMLHLKLIFKRSFFSFFSLTPTFKSFHHTAVFIKDPKMGRDNSVTFQVTATHNMK